MSNLTPLAQRALALAREEADRLRHNYVGSEHLLLGIIRLGKGVAINVLRGMGLDLEAIRREVEHQVGQGPDQIIIGLIPYTPRARKVLALAAEEARALHHAFVGSEHILLGLLRERDGIAARVLNGFGVSLDQTRQAVVMELTANTPAAGVEVAELPKPHQNAPNEASRPQVPGSAESPSNFTPRAQQVLAFSREEAARLKHSFTGTEHLLLGLIRLGNGVAVNVLRKLGLELDNVRAQVEKEVGPGPGMETSARPPYTPRVKRALVLAAREARALSHTYVGTEHILLALLREGDGVAAQILARFGVDTEKTRQEILKELNPNFGQS